MIAVGFVVGSLAASAPAQAASRSKGGSSVAPRKATTSYRFDNIPVRSALQLLAEAGRFNLVVVAARDGGDPRGPEKAHAESNPDLARS